MEDKKPMHFTGTAVVLAVVVSLIMAGGGFFISKALQDSDPLTDAMRACVYGKNVTMVFNYAVDGGLLDSFAIQCQHSSDIDKNVLININDLLKEKRKSKK